MTAQIVMITSLARPDILFRVDLSCELDTIIKIKGGRSATPALRMNNAAITRIHAKTARTIKHLLPFAFVARFSTARQEMEQPKNGTSVRGIVICFTTTKDSRIKEQINRTMVLSLKNSKIIREYVAYSPTDKNIRFNVIMVQECAKPALIRISSNNG